MRNLKAIQRHATQTPEVPYLLCWNDPRLISPNGLDSQDKKKLFTALASLPVLLKVGRGALFQSVMRMIFLPYPPFHL